MLGPESHFDKVKDVQSATLLKNTPAQVFSANFTKSVRTSFYQNTSG